MTPAGPTVAELKEDVDLVERAQAQLGKDARILLRFGEPEPWRLTGRGSRAREVLRGRRLAELVPGGLREAG